MQTSNTPAPVVRPAPVRARFDHEFAAFIDACHAAMTMAEHMQAAMREMMASMQAAYAAGVEAQRRAAEAAAVTAASASAVRRDGYRTGLLTRETAEDREAKRRAAHKAEVAKLHGPLKLLRGAA